MSVYSDARRCLPYTCHLAQRRAMGCVTRKVTPNSGSERYRVPPQQTHLWTGTDLEDPQGTVLVSCVFTESEGGCRQRLGGSLIASSCSRKVASVYVNRTTVSGDLERSRAGHIHWLTLLSRPDRPESWTESTLQCGTVPTRLCDLTAQTCISTCAEGS